MGKNYNCFMSKKGFHPGSAANQKKIEEAEAQAATKRKKQQELAEKYRKEQELFQQRAMISNESKEKLSLSFMYDVPKELKKKDDKKELDKVEWTSSKRPAPISEPTEPKSQTSNNSTSSSSTTKGISLEWKREPRKKKPKIEVKKEQTIIKTEQSSSA